MNMVKEGIQTRRRKQKNSPGNSIAKSKHNKTSMKSGTSDTNHNHGLITKTEEYVPRPGNYQYGEMYPPHVHLVHHSFEQHQRYSSQQQLEMTTNGFDAELCAREILTSPIHNNDEQHLNVIKTVNSNQP
jgi:hypothetical protein